MESCVFILGRLRAGFGPLANPSTSAWAFASCICVKKGGLGTVSPMKNFFYHVVLAFVSFVVPKTLTTLDSYTTHRVCVAVPVQPSVHAKRSLFPLDAQRCSCGSGLLLNSF
jgi:hypothetical protein